MLSVFLNVSKKNNLLVPPYLGYFQNDILGYQAFQLNFSPDLPISLIILSLASVLIMNITTNWCILFLVESSEEGLGRERALKLVAEI